MHGVSPFGVMHVCPVCIQYIAINFSVAPVCNVYACWLIHLHPWFRECAMQGVTNIIYTIQRGLHK